MADKSLRADKPHTFTQYRRYDRNASGSIVATNKNNAVTTFNNVFVPYGDNADWTLPGSYVNSTNLPATLQFKVGSNVVRTLTVDLAAAESGGGGDVDFSEIEARLIPEGGETAQMLVKASDDTGDVLWADAITAVTTVRLWESPQLYFTSQFQGGLPAWFSTSVTGAGITATTATTPTVASSLGSSKPTFDTALFAPAPTGTTTGGTQDNSLNIATMRDWTGITVTSVKVWLSMQRASGGTFHGDVLTDAVSRRTDAAIATTTTGNAWTQVSYPITKTGVLKFRITKDTGTSVVQPSGYFVTGVEVYGTPQPYMLGDIVRYGGDFYRSMMDNNPNIPDTLNNWQLV